MARIFIIDDDLIYQRIININLTRFGRFQEIKMFNSGAEPLQYLVTHQNDDDRLPDVILLDLNMPGVNGWEFLEAYSLFSDKLVHSIAVFITTSSVDPTDRINLFKYAFVKDYIVKPIPETFIKNL